MARGYKKDDDITTNIPVQTASIVYPAANANTATVAKIEAQKTADLARAAAKNTQAVSPGAKKTIPTTTQTIQAPAYGAPAANAQPLAGYSAVTSTGGTVNYTTPEAINFIENANRGDYMTSKNGLVFEKNWDGTTTVTGRDGVTATVGNTKPLSYNDIQYFLNSVSANSPAYGGNQWDPTADALMRTALSMNYDNWAQGPQYAALASQYSNLGRQAMQNTLGQVSARTGGLASSYAGSAAQQAYNDYMTRLQDAALQMYQSDRGDAIQNAQLAAGMGDRDYGRWLDTLNQYNADRSFAADLLNRAISQQNYENEWNYQLGRDAIADERYADKTAYDRDWTQKQWDYKLQQDEQTRNEALAKLMAGIGDYSRFKELGLTDEEIQALQDAYWQMQMSGGGSGGGGGSGRSGGGGGNPSGSGVSWSDVEKYASGHSKSETEEYVKTYATELGFSSMAAAVREWKKYIDGKGGITYDVGGGRNIYDNNGRYSGRTGSSSSGGKSTTPVLSDVGFGTAFVAAQKGAEALKAENRSNAEIETFLKSFSRGTQLTDEGMRRILQGLGYN